MADQSQPKGKTITWGDSHKVKAPVTVTAWADNSSSVRRLPRGNSLANDPRIPEERVTPRPVKQKSLDYDLVRPNIPKDRSLRLLPVTQDVLAQSKRGYRASLDEATKVELNDLPKFTNVGNNSNAGARSIARAPSDMDTLDAPGPMLRRLSVKDLVQTIKVDRFSMPEPGHHDRGRRPSQAAATQREDMLKFEQVRIKALQEERLHIQKKTFTKWMNSFLQKARMEVEDLFTDLADGKKLLKLLEIISGEKLGKPNNGRMRVHKVENVNKSLAFLQTKKSLPPTAKKLRPTKPCRVCTQAKKRKETRFFCPACQEKPALCVEDCFKKFQKQ